MTLFSFGVPIVHLREFEPFQDFTFALSFLLENRQYERYIQSKCKSGSYVVIDNSFNETLAPATSGHMAALYNQYHPSMVVSPDADWWDTSLTWHAFDALRELIGSEHIMTVFRSDEERALFEENSKGPLAVSYEWAEKVSQTNLSKFHFLGLQNLEFAKLHHPVSLDTSQMVKLAMRGIMFEEWDGRIKKHPTYFRTQGNHQRLGRAWEFFHTILTDVQLDLAAHNMHALKKAFL